MRPLLLVSLVVLLCTESAHTQSIRDHVRLKGNRTTTVTEAQATELTLTVTEVSVRPIQVWVRAAGLIDSAGRAIDVSLPSTPKLVRVGQRARAFSPETRSRMYQAEVTRAVERETQTMVTVSLMGKALERRQHYVVEIVTEALEVLSVPNEAIIDRGGGHTLVYVQESGGEYTPREIKPGVQGELFTQVLDGLKSGEHVVTIGSFFIDAEHKLKGS
jgi:multidrug efflux pump subunit AcrA (membrane-fusion protein)